MHVVYHASKLKNGFVNESENGLFEPENRFNAKLE